MSLLLHPWFHRPALALAKLLLGDDLERARRQFNAAVTDFRHSPLRLAERRAVDLALDRVHAALGTSRRLDALAAAQPPVKVLVVAVYEHGSCLPEAVRQLSQTRHAVTFALGSRDETADPQLAAHTLRVSMPGTKFENVNELLRAAHAQCPEPRWTLVLDSDITFSSRFLDRFIALCEHYGFAVAQPANTRRSFESYRITRRELTTLARETTFVEIGPATAFRSEAAAKLLPFPEDAGMGWFLDFHWPVVARQEGWRMGIVDATPMRHETRPGGGTYAAGLAHDAGREWLERKPHIERDDITTVTRHRRLERSATA